MSYVQDVFVRAGDWLTHWFNSVSTSETIDFDSSSETIQWIGGPLDGFEREVDAASVWQLPPTMEYASNRGLSVKRPCAALYRLDFIGPLWVYRFEKWDARTLPPRSDRASR